MTSHHSLKLITLFCRIFPFRLFLGHFFWQSIRRTITQMRMHQLCYAANRTLFRLWIKFYLSQNTHHCFHYAVLVVHLASFFFGTFACRNISLFVFPFPFNIIIVNYKGVLRRSISFDNRKKLTHFFYI